MIPFSTTTILRYFRFWPPFLFSRISVKEFDLEQGYVVSQLKLSFWNANMFGTHFGGSLFAMCDPFFVILLNHKLGNKYYIWDIASEIKFLKASRKPVTAQFRLEAETVNNLIAEAASGEKLTPVFRTQIIDFDGSVIAEVAKTIYIKLKPKYR